MKLTLPLNLDRQLASWNRTLLRMLEESGLFEVERSASLPQLSPRQYGRLTGNLCVVALDDTLVAICSWDTAAPASRTYEDGLWKPGGLFADVRLLLKLQMQRGERYWEAFTAATGVPVSPWTIWPAAEWTLGCFKWHDACHEFQGAVTGVMRYGRGAYFEAARADPGWYTSDDPKDKDWNRYVEAIKQCRWGVSLKGRKGSDGKNRREIEYASCGMPLALNYQPFYPFPFEPGVHYVYLQSPDDMLALQDIDPQPFAAAAAQVYRDYWSPAGMARLFVRLVEQHCGSRCT